MADIRELSRLLRELDDQMIACMRCGMCQAVCPLYAETGRETDVARGKIVLLERLSQELLKDPKGVKQRLDNCLLCGSCAAACPSGVKVLDLFLKARTIINGYLGLPPAKKAVFRQVLTRPALFNGLVSIASKFQGVFTRSAGSEILGASCARFESGPLKDRHFMPLAKTPWHKQVPEINQQAGPGDTRVAFFPGCLVDKVFPDVAQSVHKSLEHHGIKIYMPANQSCCGIPALSSGDSKSFVQLVRQNLKLFSEEDFHYLVTPCATCTATIKEIWPMMGEYFLPAEKEKIEKIAGITMDITQFLADQVNMESAGNQGKGIKITYHDPCHLKKSLNVHTQPRDLIKANPNYTLVEMDEADRCCGMGGSFGLQNYELSKKVGDRKLRNIIESEAEVVSTACPACMLQIIDLLSRSNARVQVKHAVQIYAQNLPSQKQ
jgi:glycolate oxidase iron-sulfur subunit